MARTAFAKRNGLDTRRRWSALALLVGALALFARVALAVPCLPTPQSDALIALSELTASDVALCAHASDDGSSKPIHASDCCSDLCCAACHPFSTLPPTMAAGPATIVVASAAIPPPPSVLPNIARAPRSALPRGPPISV